MKKILFFTILVLFVSCSKEPEITTYQVFNNTAVYERTTPYFDGSMYEVTVFCYAGTDVVREDNYDKNCSW